jgi:anaerobic selenocysteine-containing dehydrogenase
VKFSRRGFLQALGVTAGAATVSGGGTGCAERAARDVARWATPEEQLVPSICQQCPGGCGLFVRVLDGVVSGIAGNPQHPVNRGGLCPKAFAGLELLNDPHRVRSPMVRDGDRFRSIGWEEALGLVNTRLAELRGQGLPHTVAILGGQYRGYRDTLWRRFAEAYGTPNYIRVRCLAPERPALAHRLMQGVQAPLAPDLAEARFVLSFGVGLLESSLSPVHASLAYGQLRRAPDRPRGKFIQIDPRRSPTAVKADRWVPIVPGTDGILALGIANALIREGLHDQDYLDANAFAFEDWVDERGRRHEGFKNLVLREYGLVTVSEATGVPVEVILEIARDLGTLRPALVLGERGPAYGPDDPHTRMAIHSLNALVGNIGARGGLVLQGPLPLAAMPPVQRDQRAERGLREPRLDGAGRGESLLLEDAPRNLPARILGKEPYPVNALFLFATNPLASHPAKEEFRRALAQVPFVVSFSPFLDESARAAHLILPDHTYLERWQDDQVTHLAGFTCWSLGRPAAAPLHRTRNTADVVLEFARALGGPIAASFPWEKSEDVLYESARGLYEAGRGYVVSGPTQEALRKIFERQGYWMPEFESYDDFWDALGKRGAWWDPATLPAGRRGLFRTRSGKFEFCSSALRDRLHDARTRGEDPAGFLRALGAPDRGDLLCMAATPLPARRAEDARFPLRLNTYRLMMRPIGGARNRPWLLEQPAVHVRASWTQWVEIHPETAARLGIHDGDAVIVESRKGQVRLPARLHGGTRPDVVHMPLWMGTGPNPNDVVVDESDLSRGYGLLNATAVGLRKA